MARTRQAGGADTARPAPSAPPSPPSPSAPSAPPSPSAQRLKADVRRGMLLKEAAILFRRKGFEATSLQDIADAVGIQKGSLYYYIESKEALLFELLEETHQHFDAAVTENRGLAGDPLERLAAVVRGHAQYAMRRHGVSDLFNTAFSALDPKHRAVIIASRDSYEQYVRSLIQEAIDAGQAREGVDADAVTKLLLGMVNWIPRWYHGRGLPPTDELAEQAVALAVAAVAG